MTKRDYKLLSSLTRKLGVSALEWLYSYTEPLAVEEYRKLLDIQRETDKLNKG